MQSDSTQSEPDYSGKRDRNLHLLPHITNLAISFPSASAGPWTKGHHVRYVATKSIRKLAIWMLRAKKAETEKQRKQIDKGLV